MNGDYNVLIQKCKIFEMPAYIVRTEKNNKIGGDHALNIIEIVSDQKLRQKYNLVDDDEIEINIE